MDEATLHASAVFSKVAASEPCPVDVLEGSGALGSLAKLLGRPAGRWEASKNALWVLLKVRLG